MHSQKKTLHETQEHAVDTSYRNLFFDLLRIIAVGLIVIHHLPGMPIPIDSIVYKFLYDNGTSLTYHITSGPLGVYLLVFISGAVLHLSYQHKKFNYWDFVYKRLKRVYPSWWITMLLYYLLFPAMLLSGIYLIPQLMGALPSPAYYNWWIGLFVSLYFVYPPLKYLMARRPYMTLFAVFTITLTTRLILRNTEFSLLGFPSPAFMLDRVLLLSFLFEFVLGMFVVGKGLYFKRTHNNVLITWASEVSYYVFLLHPLIRNVMFSKDISELWHPRNFLFYLLVTLLLSSQLMSLDRLLQKILPNKLPKFRL